MSSAAAAPFSASSIYDDTWALSRLPYFERRSDGRLALADPSLGPVVDVHTHLALCYGGPYRVDVWQRHDEVQHYMPTRRRLDLDVYAIRNLSPEDLRRMKRDLSLASLGSGGMRRTHTAANLLAEMQPLGIAHSVLLAVELPVLSPNSEAYLRAAADSDGKLSVFCSVHPFAARATEQVARLHARGACGLKMHPMAQMTPPDHPRAIALYRVCGELGMPVLWHCGPVGVEPRLGRRFCQLKNYWPPIHDLPETTFILGHSGALQWPLALELAQRYPNVYLEVASQSLSAVRRLVEEAPPDRLMFGTDWPFYHQSMALAKVLLATEDRPEMRPRVLWDNAARLLKLDRPTAGG